MDSFSDVGLTYKTPDGVYIFRDTGASVLAVAHLDTLGEGDTHFHVCDFGQGGALIFASQLDDRLGAWAILDKLPQLGLKYDVLLTEGEEYARSTARHFRAPRQYNWIFSLDRAGDDVVGYWYESDAAWEPAVKKAGRRRGNGSYSDISELTHLRCLGFNIGTGYENAHSVYAYARLEAVEDALKYTHAFYQLHADQPMPYAPKVRKSNYVQLPVGGYRTAVPVNSAAGWNTSAATNWDEGVCEVCGKVYYDLVNISCITHHDMCRGCYNKAQTVREITKDVEKAKNKQPDRCVYCNETFIGPVQIGGVPISGICPSCVDEQLRDY
jgi:hypothetical protein